MCGIVGYFGQSEALPVLLSGLERLEYRGYDSAGLAICNGGEVVCRKAVGKLQSLKDLISGAKIQGSIGIAHTRWATHGAPTEINAHPHCDCQGKIWLAHNGIIENYQELKTKLTARGHKFKSETDTEAVAHLIEENYQGDLVAAVRKSLKIIKGAYALVIFHQAEDKIVFAKHGSPLVVGINNGDTIVASDASAIVQFTKEVKYLEDGEIGVISAAGFRLLTLDNQKVERESKFLEWDLEDAQKGGYAHFMLKEIFSQPDGIINSTRGRMIVDEGLAKFGGLERISHALKEIKKVVLVGCGTAHYATLVGEYWLEELAGLPARAIVASDLRYRNYPLDAETLVIAVSQSGETADTLAAVKEAKSKGALTYGIVNAVESAIARLTDAGTYNHIGPEIAVASTKAFTSQLAILCLSALFLGRQRKVSATQGRAILSEIKSLPDKIQRLLNNDSRIREIADKYQPYEHFAFLGRQRQYPIALEGALKLKEISYIHAEGYNAGEMKHGPIALISPDFPSVYICLRDSMREKNVSNIMEIKARGGKVIVIASEGDEEIAALADDIIFVPPVSELLAPILTVVPLQLFAYHMAVLRGCDVDQPRNLAKSVTVE